MFGLFKGKNRAVSTGPLVLGGDSCTFPIVGESNYQAAIKRTHKEHGDYFDVVLVREPRNPHDRNAVRVDSPHGQVGYFPREVAAHWAEYLDRTGPVRCRGHVRKGKTFDGVMLNLDPLPPGNR